MSVTFLELDDVVAIHAESIRRFGGAMGLRDGALLESAIAMPRATMFGELLHATVHEQAAAYLFHLVKNHPFVDGNKRTGLAAALVFLGLNGIWVDSTMSHWSSSPWVSRRGEQRSPQWRWRSLRNPNPGEAKDKSHQYVVHIESLTASPAASEPCWTPAAPFLCERIARSARPTTLRFVTALAPTTRVDQPATSRCARRSSSRR